MTDQELRLKCVELAVTAGNVDLGDYIYKYIAKDFSKNYWRISHLCNYRVLVEPPCKEEDS